MGVDMHHLLVEPVESVDQAEAALFPKMPLERVVVQELQTKVMLVVMVVIVVAAAHIPEQVQVVGQER
tara:strand:+ start:215 stop:418 length:204 start_codon:yes stop_codon:yes gene_type:complete